MDYLYDREGWSIHEIIHDPKYNLEDKLEHLTVYLREELGELHARINDLEEMMR